MKRSKLLQGSAAALGVAAFGGGAAAAEARKSTLAIAMPTNPETIDPHQFRSVLTGSMLGCVMETLLTRDPDNMELRPMLATSWRPIDQRTWEFKLRKGVKFSNGEDFNAESVKFSIDRIIKSKLNTLGRTVWPPSFGQDVIIIDPYTVHITTKVPDPIVPNRVAAESMGMVPPRAFAPYADKYMPDTMIGTGPYKFAEYVVGDRFSVQANPGYWGAKPQTPRVLWQVMPDPATRSAALQRQSVDIVTNLAIPLIPNVKKDPALTVYSKLGSIVYGLLLDANTTPQLKDRRVRQALNYAVDRKTILREIFKGQGELANGVVASQVQYFSDPGSYPYDPAKAKALLNEAGLGGGFDVTIWQATNRWIQGEETAQAVAGYFAKVGVRTNLQYLEWGDYNARASRAALKNAFYYGFVNGVWDPAYIIQRFLPSYPTFRMFDATGELAKEIDQYAVAFSPAERRALTAKIQKGLHEEAAWVFLWQLDETFGLTKKVRGFKMRPDHFIYVRDAYVLA